jgi:hypothetical protein
MNKGHFLFTSGSLDAFENVRAGLKYEAKLLIVKFCTHIETNRPCRWIIRRRCGNWKKTGLREGWFQSCWLVLVAAQEARQSSWVKLFAVR